MLIGFALRQWNTSNGLHRHTAAAHFSKVRSVPLTSLPGAVWGPAFSPDGSQIVYVWDGENPDRGDLYLQQVGGAQPLRLTQSHSGFICCVDWSPDGKQIVFSRCGDNGDEIMVISALGGPERRLTNGECPYWIAGRPIWIGKSILVRDRCTPGSPPGLVLFWLETGTKKCLHDPPPGGLGDSDRAVSPDQQSVAFIGSASTFRNEIYTVPIQGGPAKRITFDASNITELMWSPDGKYLIFNSSRGGLPAVWRVPAAGGPVEPETVYPEVGTLTHDGSRLAYVEPGPFFRTTSEIWRADLAGSGGPVKTLKKILDSSGGNDSPQPSPSKFELAFSSYRTGAGEIWKSDLNGNQPVQLTSFGGHAGTPRWSPDGKWICFDFGTDTHSQIYVVDSEGRNAHALTSGESENLVPSWSKDGAYIYFASNRTGEYQIWKLKLATGAVKQITHQGGFAALESYDSKDLYFTKFIGAGVWTVPMDGGPETRITEAPHVGYWGHFAVTERGIYLLDADAPALGDQVKSGHT
jgi:Tol biopolymer transport system component